MSKDVLIVGAGLGGLLCGRILSRRGFTVTVLEADTFPGGILHGFEWEGAMCERGFHSVGGLAPGEPLEKIFRPLGLMDLPWYRADADEGLGFLRLNSFSDFEMEHILRPFAKSTWRLEGGGTTLSRALAEGLDIRYGKKVTAIENQVVTCEDGSSFRADYVISDLHPAFTMHDGAGPGPCEAGLYQAYCTASERPGHLLRPLPYGAGMCAVAERSHLP